MSGQEKCRGDAHCCYVLQGLGLTKKSGPEMLSDGSDLFKRPSEPCRTPCPKPMGAETDDRSSVQGVTFAAPLPGRIRAHLKQPRRRHLSMLGRCHASSLTSSRTCHLKQHETVTAPGRLGEPQTQAAAYRHGQHCLGWDLAVNPAAGVRRRILLAADATISLF